MASLQDVIARATRHLSDMTLSQRLAIGLGALLVVGSLIWLAQWAATPEMVPLLPNQSLEPEELALVRGGLEAVNEPYRIEGSQVLVRASANRPAVLASLQQAEKLPGDMAIGFAELVKEANPWISQAENRRRWTVALQSELARVLKEFNGVRQARVVLNLNTRPPGFSRNHPESSAGVTLFMRGGEPVARSLALAAARMVAGAVPSLPPQNVHVLDGENNRVALDWDTEENDTASSLHQQRRQLEREKQLQIKQQLGFDKNALVSVSVELDFSTLHEQNLTMTEGVAVKEQSESTSTVRNRRAAQPGVEPNVGNQVGAGGEADTSTTERSETVLEPGRSTRTMQTPAGVPKRITAAVSLSYGYLSSVYRLNNPEGDPPDEEQIANVFNSQKDRIITQLAKLVVPPEPEQISIDWHYEAFEPQEVVVASTLETPLELARKYGPASGLGLLALLSLGLMMRLARRREQSEPLGMEIGLPKEAIDAAKKAAEDLASATLRPVESGANLSGFPTGTGFTDGKAAKAIPIPVGQGAEALLEAREVDESALQVSQMINQVAATTDQDAEGVAALIENWVGQDQ